MQSLLTTCMRRVYPPQEGWNPKKYKAVTSTSWPVFPDGDFPAILAQESGHVGTTPTVPQDQTSGQAEEVPPSDSPAATGASVSIERPPSPRAPLPSLPLHDQGDAAPPTVQVEATLTVPPAVPESGGALAFSINVEAFEENGADFNWTLSLNGFKKGQHIYIYDDVKKAGCRVTDGVQIIDPAAQVVMIKARASLFDLSKQGKYEFR